MAGPMTTDSSSAESEPDQVAVQGTGALMLPIPKSNARKKGPPQFLPPEEERSDAPLLLNPMSRSPMRRNWPDAASPGHTADRTCGAGATSTAASSTHMSHYPSESPGSGSKGWECRDGREKRHPYIIIYHSIALLYPIFLVQTVCISI